MMAMFISYAEGLEQYMAKLGALNQPDDGPRPWWWGISRFINHIETLIS